jgi:transposase
MFYCGIDVAKRKHAVVVLDERGHIKRSVFEISNNLHGLKRLVDELKPFGEDVQVGLEATGHYWLSLYEMLTEYDYPIYVINPLQVAAYRRSGLRKVKNDKTDAIWIADFLRISEAPVTSRDIPALLQLKEISRFRFRLSEQIGICKRKVLTILDKVFPEYEKLFSNVFVKSSRAMLQQAVSAQEFADFNLQELTTLISRTSRGQFGQAKAKQIQEKARQSVGVGFLADAAQVEIRCLLAQLDLLEDQRDEVGRMQEELMESIPQYITTIPGIGIPTGAAILSEIGAIERFKTPAKLIAYAGIDATVHQSGQFKAAESHMSKRGSPYLRLALWQAASMAIRYNEELKIYYQKKRAEGKAHGTALGAVCRKLLIRVYVILKENRPYEIREIPSITP